MNPVGRRCRAAGLTGRDVPTTELGYSE
jgi:hypothetical protein